MIDGHFSSAEGEKCRYGISSSGLWSIRVNQPDATSQDIKAWRSLWRAEVTVTMEIFNIYMTRLHLTTDTAQTIIIIHYDNEKE